MLSRMYLYFVMSFCLHFASTTPTAITRAVSVTNIDSIYVPITGHTGVHNTGVDSVSDSLFFPVLANGLNNLYGPSHMDIGVHCSDTLTDSVFVLINHVKAYALRVFKGNNDVYFAMQFGQGAGQGIPDLYELYFKMKNTSPISTGHVIRVTPNFISQP